MNANTKYVADLVEALNRFIEWDGETWRINSEHPNDRGAADEWGADIAKARELVSKAPPQHNTGE